MRSPASRISIQACASNRRTNPAPVADPGAAAGEGPVAAADGGTPAGSAGDEAPEAAALRTDPANGTGSTVVPLLTVVLGAETGGAGSAAMAGRGTAAPDGFAAVADALPDEDGVAAVVGLESAGPPASLIPSKEAPPPKKKAMTINPTTARIVQVSQFPGPLDENPRTPRRGMG